MATSSSAAALEADDGSSGLSAEQAADDTYAYTLKCETGFIVAGLQEGEAASAFVRVLCTLITASVVSAWVTRRDCIYKLPLFFSHWLSGLVHQLVYLIGATMISVCWAGENLATFIKTLKFLELFASNMLAITNLAICVNLALIVLSRRPQSHVRSISTHKLVLLFLAISAGLAAIAVPFWGVTVLSGTGFWELGENKRDHQFVMISTFMVEFLVGIFMFVIVSWLLLFRMTEIKECWMMHACLRYYFGLTLLGTVGNLTLGVCGTIYVISDMAWPLLMIFSWGFRQVRIALDTIVLHSVLATKSVDERAETPPSDDASPPPSREFSRVSAARRSPPPMTVSFRADGVVSGRGSLPPSESGRKTSHRLSINRGLRAMAGVKRAELENQSRDIRLAGSVPVRPRSRSGEPPDEPTVWLWN